MDNRLLCAEETSAMATVSAVCNWH